MHETYGATQSKLSKTLQGTLQEPIGDDIGKRMLERPRVRKTWRTRKYMYWKPAWDIMERAISGNPWGWHTGMCVEQQISGGTVRETKREPIVWRREHTWGNAQGVYSVWTRGTHSRTYKKMHEGGKCSHRHYVILYKQLLSISQLQNNLI